MKSLLLLLTLLSFTIYKAGQNESSPGLSSLIKKGKKVPGIMTDAEITAAFQEQLKNKS